MRLSFVRFVIVTHPRLDFRNAKSPVADFVLRRIQFEGVSEIRFVEDMNSARTAVASMIDQSAAGFIVISDIMNPIIDCDLVQSMIGCLERTDASLCLCDGAIPGTQVELVLNAARMQQLPEDLSDPAVTTVRQRWFSQDRFNNQFNLYKYKRLKLFLCLLEHLDRMHEMSIEEFISTLESEKIFSMLAAFGEAVRLVRYERCPHCNGQLTPLPMRMSQPFCGYLPASRPLYHECEKCGLVVASPAVHEDDVPRVYDEFDKQDFVVSLNNPYDGNSPRCDFSAFEGHFPENAKTIDLGGGIGRFSEFVKDTHPAWVVTHSDFAIKRNEHLQERGIQTRELNFLKEPIGRESYHLITAWEVIEHIPYHRLADIFENIYQALVPGGYFVFSTPDFDSPLCRSYDFFAMCPPFHFLVFGERWLRNYFSKSPKWNYCKSRGCSDFLDDAVMWSNYGAKTCPSFQLRAASNIFSGMFKADQSGEMRRTLLRQGFATEVIITLQKI